MLDPRASDINHEATRAQCERSGDLRRVARPGGHFHPDDIAMAALDEALCSVTWRLEDRVTEDACVIACIGAFVPWLAERGWLPSPHIAEDDKIYAWSDHRMLFAGLGHAHHAAVVRALDDVKAGCPWTDEDESTWQDSVREARHKSLWPATLLLVPWRQLSQALLATPDQRADPTDDKREPPWWGEACLLWHLIRHLRRSDTHGLVYTYGGRFGALAFPPGIGLIASQTSVQALAHQLGVSVATGKKDAHPFCRVARDVFVSTNRNTLLPRAPLALLPSAVIASPAATYALDRSREDRFFQHGLRVTETWFAENGVVRDAVEHATPHDIILGYDWNPSAIGADDLDGQSKWKERLITTYDTTLWPSAIFSQCFPNTLWMSLGHRSWFDAIALLSVVRRANPGLDQEFPFLVILPEKPDAADAIRNGKTAATKSLVSLFNPNAIATRVGASMSAPDMRAIFVGIRDSGTLGLDEWRLPLDAVHPLSAPSLATFCIGGSNSCGLVLSNVPQQVRLRHPLVANAKTLALPTDVESRAFFLWLGKIPDAQTADGAAFKAASNGQLGLRMRLTALALAEDLDIINWLQGRDASTTADGSRFGLHRQTAAACYQAQYGGTYENALEQIDIAHKGMLKHFRAHTDKGRESGLLDMQESGRVPQLVVEQLFDVTPEMMATLVDGIEIYARTSTVTARQLLRGVLAPYLAAGDQAALGVALSRHTGIKSYENATPKLLGTILAQDLDAKLPEPGAKHMFHGDLGLAGWWIERVELPDDDTRGARYSFGNNDPTKLIRALRKKQRPLEAPHSPNRGAPTRS